MPTSMADRHERQACLRTENGSTRRKRCLKMPCASLEGIKVVDFSRVLAGPFAGQSLADLGADVIKIENPLAGDDTRGWGIPVGTRMDSTYYFAVNRSKRSLALDLTTKEGQAIAADIASQADILLENFKDGGMAKFGLDYETLSKRNPRLIYASVSGYGRTGPQKHRLGYDLVIQAEAGLMFTNGSNGDDPLKTGVAVVDLFTGMFTLQAVLAALTAREKIGKGQYIDISLIDCGFALLSYLGSSAMFSGKDTYRWGNNHPDIVPYGLFEAMDGPLIIAIGNDAQFHRLCKDVLRRDDLAFDERFKKNHGRMEHRADLMKLFTETLKTKTRAELHAGMEKYDVPGGSVRRVSEALNSEDCKSRGMTVKVPHPEVGEIGLFRSPVRLSDTPVRAPTRPPQLGEHTDEVLRQCLKLDDKTLKQLRDRKIIR
jgi:crotonobetainyl-CoA:carnitine CoA-transferase CaiB-like acyl-CoA transferase